MLCDRDLPNLWLTPPGLYGAMTAPLRIAICLSGQPRTWRHCAASLRQLFAGHDVQFYLHSWADVPDDTRSEMQAVYAPRQAVFESMPDFSFEQADLLARFPVVPPINCFGMAYGMQRSLRMALDDDASYDLIVRARYDSLFDGTLSFAHPLPAALFVPFWPDEAGYDDQFAIGTPAAMAVYAAFCDWLRSPQLSSHKPGWFRPEQGLYHHLGATLGHDHIQLIRPRMKLLRPTQAGLPYDEVGEDIFHQIHKQSDTHDFAAQVGLMAQDGGANIQPLMQIRAEHAALQTALAAMTDAQQRVYLHGSWRDHVALLDQLLCQLTPPPVDVERARIYTAIYLNMKRHNPNMDGYRIALQLISPFDADRTIARTWQAEHPDDARAVAEDQALWNSLKVLGALIQPA